MKCTNDRKHIRLGTNGERTNIVSEIIQEDHIIFES
jgi:hypothetical protein